MLTQNQVLVHHDKVAKTKITKTAILEEAQKTRFQQR